MTSARRKLILRWYSDSHLSHAHSKCNSKMGSNLSADNVSNSSVAVFGEQYANVKEKKRAKMATFASLKRRFIRKRKCSKCYDHARVLREFVSSWTATEVKSLLEEYEALATLKDLTIQAELARPPAATYKQDLCALFDFKYCVDVDVVYRNTCFPAHRAILSTRCHYFREKFRNYPPHEVQIRVDLKTPCVTIQTFSAFLRYLYIGDVSSKDGEVDLVLLRRLVDELGVPNQLEQDLRYLLETGNHFDTTLIFSSEDEDCQLANTEFGFRQKLELNCHKAILCARSPFFRNVIKRRQRYGDWEYLIHCIPYTKSNRIMLDDMVIPKKYAKVLMHAIYLDGVDVSLILRGSGCATTSSGSLSEVEVLTKTGSPRPTHLEEVMELYQIGRFLDLEIVAQGCEDLILEYLTMETLPSVLKWGSQAHGSAWVYRQAKQFLCEEFSQLVNSSILADIEQSYFVDFLRNDFLQASELEVLQAVLNWSEKKLAAMKEEKADQVGASHTPSASRKVVRRKECHDLELKEIISELLPYVRFNHIIPPNNELLNQMIRRGLVSIPTTGYMLALDSKHSISHTWIMTQTGVYIRPRLFMPYYEEIKALVEFNMSHNADLLKSRRFYYMPDIASSMRIVDNRLCHSYSSLYGGKHNSIINNPLSPIPDNDTMMAMLKREKKLKATPSCQRALSLRRSSKYEINRQIRLRIVREFNLPDSVADLLEQTCYCNNLIVDGAGNYVDNSQYTMTFPRSVPQRSRVTRIPTMDPSAVTGYEMMGNNACSEGQLSDTMPDVAMDTTASSLAHLTLSSYSNNLPRGAELELDLGDGGVATASFRQHSRYSNAVQSSRSYL